MKEKKEKKSLSPKKQELIILIIGAVLFTGALLFFILFYRPFVPWQKIVCSEEDGTYIELNKKDVKYIYEINGVKYEKILNNVPYDAIDTSSESVRNIIYVNLNNPLDVKQGSRGDGLLYL